MNKLIKFSAVCAPAQFTKYFKGSKSAPFKISQSPSRNGKAPRSRCD
jgi:hypothetical protein